MPRSDQGDQKSAGRYAAVPRTLSFVTNGDDVLLLRGAPAQRIWPNRYNGVGGHVEAGEDIYTGAVREIEEETGLEVSGARLCGIVNIDAGEEMGIILFVFTAQAQERAVRPSSEGTLEWVRRDQITSLDLVEDLPELMARVLAMGHCDPPFFARYYYDERDKLVITFANDDPGYGR